MGRCGPPGPRRTARRRRGRAGVIVAVVVALAAGGTWWALGSSGDSCVGCPDQTDGSGQRGTGRPQAARLQHHRRLSALPRRDRFARARSSAPRRCPSRRASRSSCPGRARRSRPMSRHLPGPSMQVALANEVGAWTRDYVEMNLDGLARMVDRAGGLSVDLPLAVVTPSGVLGPGDVEFNGIEVAALMRAEGGDPDLRWADDAHRAARRAAHPAALGRRRTRRRCPRCRGPSTGRPGRAPFRCRRRRSPAR